MAVDDDIALELGSGDFLLTINILLQLLLFPSIYMSLSDDY
jgi:hypothetical protein